MKMRNLIKLLLGMLIAIAFGSRAEEAYQDAKIRFFDVSYSKYETRDAQVSISGNQYILESFSTLYPDVQLIGSISQESDGEYVTFGKCRGKNDLYGWPPRIFCKPVNFYIETQTSFWEDPQGYDITKTLYAQANGNVLKFKLDRNTGNLYDPVTSFIISKWSNKEFKWETYYYSYSRGGDFEWYKISYENEIYPSASVAIERFPNNIPSMPIVTLNSKETGTEISVYALKYNLNGEELLSTGPYEIELYISGELFKTYPVDWVKADSGDYYCKVNETLEGNDIGDSVYARLVDLNPDSGIYNPEVESSSVVDKIYDLTGKQVNESNLAPGIYIRAGKKILVK